MSDLSDIQMGELPTSFDEYEDIILKYKAKLTSLDGDADIIRSIIKNIEQTPIILEELRTIAEELREIKNILY